MHRVLVATVSLLCATASHAFERGRAEKDDPALRMQSRILREGLLSPEALLRVQQTAQQELSRSRLQRQAPSAPGAAVATPIAPGVLVNVGPEGSTFDWNGVLFDNLDSGRSRTILPHPTNNDVLYFANAGGGVWKTFDATAAQPHWESITDEQLPGLGIGSLALDPHSPDSLVLGMGDPFDIPMPGVFTSDDGGVRWSTPTILTGCYAAAPPLCGTSTSVRDLKFNGGNTGIVLAATNIGLFRNTAHATGSWTLIEMPTTVPHTPMDCWSVAWVGRTTWMLACTDDSNAGYWGTGYLWRSTDDGASWNPISLPAVSLNQTVTPPGRMTVSSSAGDASTPGSARMYVLASDVGGFHQLDVFKSVDGGALFTALGVNSNNPPTNPNSDQTDLNVMHDQAWYNQAIQADGDTVFVGGNLSLVRSTDGGAHWNVVANWLPYNATAAGVTFNALGIPYVHADYHAMAIGTAGSARALYAGTDGGLFRSKDTFTAAPGVPATGPGGTVSPTFDDAMNRGLPTHLLQKICAGSEAVGAPNVVLGGLQDNGSRLRNTGTPTLFDMVTGGDGIGCGVGKAGGTGAFGSLVITTYPAFVNRSIDSGATFNDAVTGLPNPIDQQTNFHMQIANDPSDATAQTFLTPINSAPAATITAQVFRTADGAANWADITGTVTGTTAAGGLFDGMLLGVTTHPTSSGKYVAFSGGRIFVTTNASGSTPITWSRSPAVNTAWQPLGSAAFDPGDSTGQTVWIASHAGPNGGSHVFKTTNATNASPTWTDVSGRGGANPLPDVPANVVRVDPLGSSRIYVGTDIGLYVSSDSAANWTRFGGMPSVKVNDLSIASDGTSVRVATYGRGFWELYPKAAVPSAMRGNGDLDGNQVVDGIDLVIEALQLDTDVTSPGYDPKANLTGATNSITWDDMVALLAKFGGRP